MRGSLCGYVVEGDTGRPVGKAVVQAFSSDAQTAQAAPTDRAGWFVLDNLPEGQWRLQARGPDREVGQASAPVFANAFSDVTIRVKPSCAGWQGAEMPPSPKGRVTPMQHGSVSGRVVRAGTGEPIQDASVSVVSGAGPAPDIAPLSNEQGRFMLDGLPAGDWTLRARSPDNQTGVAQVRVAAGEVASLSIVVPA